MTLFYVVKTHPDKWKPFDKPLKFCPEANSMQRYTRDIDVVSIKPWQHFDFKIGKLSIKGRQSWGASEPKWINEIVYYNIKRQPLRVTLDAIVVHHTNNTNTIQNVEQKQVNKGYAAIGYHFFVSQNGDIYEGRPLEVMGSHAGAGFIPGPVVDPDFGKIGITMQGDYHHADDWFSSENTPNSQLVALEKLITELKGAYSINRLLMHREVKRKGKPTVCPGDHMVPHVLNLRKKLKMEGPK